MLSVATRLRGPQQVLRLLEFTASASASPFLPSVWLFRALSLRVIADEVGAHVSAVSLCLHARTGRRKRHHVTAMVPEVTAAQENFAEAMARDSVTFVAAVARAVLEVLQKRWDSLRLKLQPERNSTKSISSA